MTIKKQIKCSQCGKVFIYGESPFRPFCSERCKMIDLGHWFNETYQVPSKHALSEEDLMAVEKFYNGDEENDEES